MTCVGQGLVEFEKELADVSGKYCVGDSVTLADICLIPQLYGARRFGVEMDQFPRILAIEARLKTHPAFQRADAGAQPDAA